MVVGDVAGEDAMMYVDLVSAGRLAEASQMLYPNDGTLVLFDETEPIETDRSI